jgi:hypothetical protein
MGTDTKAGTTGARWIKVGVCDSPQSKIGCWLDTSSVKSAIEITPIQNQTLQAVTNNFVNNIDKTGYTDLEGNGIIGEVKKIGQTKEPLEKIKLINEIYSTTYLNSNKALLVLLRAREYGELAKTEMIKKGNEKVVASTSASERIDTTNLKPTENQYIFHDTANDKYYNTITNAGYDDYESAFADVPGSSTSSESQTATPGGDLIYGISFNKETKKLEFKLKQNYGSVKKVAYKIFLNRDFWPDTLLEKGFVANKDLFSRPIFSYSVINSGTYIVQTEFTDNVEKVQKFEKRITVTQDDLTSTTDTTPETPEHSFLMATNLDFPENHLQDADPKLIEFLNCINEEYYKNNNMNIFVNSITDDNIYLAGVSNKCAVSNWVDANCQHVKDSCHYKLSSSGKLQSQAADIDLSSIYTKEKLQIAYNSCKTTYNSNRFLVYSGHVHVNINSCTSQGNLE